MSGPPHLRLPVRLPVGWRRRTADEASYPDLSEALDDAGPMVAGNVAVSYPGLVAEVCADLDGASRADQPTVRVYPRLLEPVHQPPPVDDERVRPLYSRVLRLHHVDPGGLLCFLFFEGTVALGLLLALAELVSWWGVLVLPVTVAVMVKLNDLVAAAVVRNAARVPDLEQERFRREMLPAVGRARVPDAWKISPYAPPPAAIGAPDAYGTGNPASFGTGNPAGDDLASGFASPVGGGAQAGGGTADRTRPQPGTSGAPESVEPGAAEALPAVARVVLGRVAASRIRANSGHPGSRRTTIGRPANAHPAAGERTEQWPGQQAGRWTDPADPPQQRARQSGTHYYEQ
ncbi:hypothetical protein [Micromonospora sp. NBC_01699]|uniref:hypothetical protein n=1 Tax=Micromonospora sp. NBC_01699 TaxID=2975984 RepID=UPI003FA57CD5